ncbi:disease resistance protein At4g27190-like [Magnolia sinica]|uniref:disease resistance protein At4g27190-like n=1 Tax=Magnolia sinica TaxID=86752 RepID=UPI002657C441|nr:disease resistance protein At4g27190-like [Magnolia sinica]XP_058092044.1 disease resistance protein At4g27190-like [Magnolia sinica]
MEYLKDHAVEIIQWLWPPLAEQLDYVINADAHLEALTRAAEELKCKRKDIQGDDGDGPLKKRRKLNHQAEHWINDSSNIENEVDSIKSEFEQRPTFLNGLCTNYFSRYRLGKRAVRILDEVKDLNEKTPLGEVTLSPPRPTVAEKQESLPPGQSTSEQTLEEIWQCLQDEESRIICLYGMGGIGKTTLMKAINNRLVGTQDFDIVLWVTVSKELKIERIQKEIGHELNLFFLDGEQKRDKLFTTLKDMKYMLILDDLWRDFDLEEAGIPLPNGQNRCKIAITTRFIQVSNAMEADKHIRVKTLTSEESWNLFCDKAGDVARLPGIQPLAEEVVNECSGLPLAIITVGRAMRRKDKKELWLDALRALRGSAPEIQGMEPNVFLSLKLSYDHLEDDKHKRCFLYCALFPEDYNIRIPKLLKFWTMEGYIDNVESFEDASNKGHAIIERIKEACLLEEGVSGDTHVKMHDLIRDLAIWITSTSQELKFLVRARMELKVPPKEEMWEEMGRISLMSNEIEELPMRPNCPKLESLLLRKNTQLKIIPNNFFDLMPKLQILDLSYTAIESLPMSLSLLVNLRALILKRCRSLLELPPFEQLKELEFVDLSCSAISNLPEGFGNLVKLKQLDLSNLDCLISIPNNVLSRLSRLEELRLLKTYINWSTAAEPQVMGEASLGEVASLTRLSTFDITIPNIDCLEHDVFCRRWSRFRNFAFHVGNDWVFDRLSSDNSVRIHECHHFPPGSRAMIKHAEGLGFASCSGLTRVSQVVGESKKLRQLQVYDFNGVDCVIDWREVEEGALQRLEWLNVNGLPDLEILFKGEVPQGRLRNLTSIEVSYCDKLRCLFSSSVAEHLDRLEELTVRSCDEMLEIVEGETLPDNLFPQLRRLRFERLYKLTRIISSTVLAAMNLQEMEVFRCPLLKKLPLFTSIEKIKGERDWLAALEWENENTKSLFQQKYHEWNLPRQM